MYNCSHCLCSIDIPEQPHSLMTQNVTSRNLTLTWVEPHDNNAPITGYRVFYTQPIFLNGTNVTINVTGSVEEAFIGDLHPGETYSFTVHAFNDIGVSAVSEPISQRTDEERKLLRIVYSRKGELLVAGVLVRLTI